MKYPYKPRSGSLVLGIIFCMAGFLFMAFKALTNNRGLILDYIFRFSVQGATIFYWIISGVFAAGAVLGSLSLVSALMAKDWGFIRLTQTDLQIPHGLFKRGIRSIPFTEMADVRLRQLQRTSTIRGTSKELQRWLQIQHGKKKVAIYQSYLPDNLTFEHICGFIAEKTKRIKPDSGDIEQTLDLTAWEAAHGVKWNVPIEKTGKILTIHVPPGVKSGTRLRLRGKGMPSGFAAAGDLYIVISVT